jgi:glutathione S-transferase
MILQARADIDDPRLAPDSRSAGCAISLAMENHAMSDPAITLHGTELSGHAHRVALLLRMLGLPYRFVAAPAEVRRSADFLKLNPLGQIPVLQDGPLVLADSNAIMVYLVKRYAPGSAWLPEEPVAASQVQRWLSIAAGEVMHGAAIARAIVQWNAPWDHNIAVRIAERLLRFMDGHLADRTYLAADHPTIADLACYSYVAAAPEGGISLDGYPSVRAWLRRIEGLPQFVPMPACPIPQACRRIPFRGAGSSIAWSGRGTPERAEPLTVIASRRRSNPGRRMAHLDCFVATLPAMTEDMTGYRKPKRCSSFRPGSRAARGRLERAIGIEPTTFSLGS